jgi:YVTN family beta-propeller protein
LPQWFDVRSRAPAALAERGFSQTSAGVHLGDHDKSGIPGRLPPVPPSNHTPLLRPVVAGTAFVALLGGVSLAATRSGGHLGTAHAGRQADGTTITSTGQRLTPAGAQLEFPGRPTAIAVHPDGRTATLLNSKGGELVVVDLATRKVLQTYDNGAGSYDGVAYNHAGTRLFASDAGGDVLDMAVAKNGTLTLVKAISPPQVEPSANSLDVNASSSNAYPGGLAFSRDDKKVYVTYSVLNQLGVIDVASDTLTSRIDVGNTPHSVVVQGNLAWVSDEGGRRTIGGDEFTNNSDGTPIVADKVHGAAKTGRVSVVDLAKGKELGQVTVGLHPTALALSGTTLYVANTNSDTVSVVDTRTRKVLGTVDVSPYPGAPYGSHPNGLAALKEGRLAVSLGRDNAVAFYTPPARGRAATYLGMLPTAWYPSALAEARGQLVIVNGKGLGNVGPTLTGGDGTGRQTGSSYVGSLSFIGMPSSKQLAAGIARVRVNNGWDRIDTTKARKGVAAKAIPDHVGEPSTIKHVVYVIKENRTYDQVLADDTRGNGDPALLQFGKEVTPNQHEIVKQFPLVDNFYDSGQLSADGHQWVVQGDSPDYLEKAFGGFTRSYPSQAGDALAYLPSGFIWENAKRHGKTIRDYGEYASSLGKGLTSTDVPSLQPYVVPDYPGFDPSIPDVARMEVFLHDLDDWKTAGSMPNLVMMTLPQDHTVAYLPRYPSVDTMVADNDVALGQLVEGISKSRFWKDTVILVEEDDSQNGLDHVDAHRSIFYAISPWAKHGGYVDHSYYTQVDALRTIEQILGLPPMNQMDAAATPMRSLFADKPNMSTFTQLLPTVVPLPNPPLSQLSGLPLAWARASMEMDFTHPDAIDDQLLNHAIWYADKGFTTPYPGESRVLWPSEVVVGSVNVITGRDD